jgi:outer membrane protein
MSTTNREWCIHSRSRRTIMPISFRALVVYGALMLPVVVQAESLSLDDAIRYALHHNPELRAAQAQTAAADDRAKAAKGAFLPQLGVSYLARRSDNPLDAFADKLNTRSVTAADLNPAAINDPGKSSLRATTLSIEMPIYTGGRLTAGARSANDQAETAHLAYGYRRQAIAYQTLRGYRSAQATTLAVQIAEDAVAAARQHTETTTRLVRQGRIVASDRLTAELNQSTMESLLVQAKSRQRLALEDLRLIAGLPSELEIQLPAWERLAPPPPAGANGESRALASRQDLKAQEARLRAARAGITAARSVFHPQISVVAADSWYDENAALDNKSQSIMGVVSMNLFNGGRDWHGLSAARRDADQAEAELDGVRQAVLRDVRAARSRLTEALARRQIAEQGIDKARETVRLVNQRYGEGRTILIDLLMAERVLVEARTEELNASVLAELAAAEVQLAEGTLPLPGETPTN